MAVPGRVADYNRIADKYDRRYELHAYAGVREALFTFLDSRSVSAALEVGCGTGHWLAEIAGRDRSAERPFVAGVEPATEMLARAQAANTGARLVRAQAEALPWRDATFDRLFCVNALHHFSDRVRFFRDARRILKPGGALMSIGKDPHTERDSWWVYDYFPDTLTIDRDRFGPVRVLRGELAQAGFAWAESFEVDRIEAVMPANNAFADAVVDPAYTSQLTVLSEDEFNVGVARIRDANAAAGGQLDLVTDFRLYATVGRLE
jgi:SAM-dependent methyltransferase